MKIASVVGARPNIIKMVPIHKVIRSISDHTIIHTGQHYDYELSEIFFKEFNIPKPDFNLEVGSGKYGFQVGEMIKKLEQIFSENRYDLVMVYGDTNSTLAGALTANRSGLKVAHVESGLRSFDRRMPEEINRIMVDHLSDYLFAPTYTAIRNLEREHVWGGITYTGDIAVEIVREAERLSSKSSIIKDLQLTPKSYHLLTMHRAENTDFTDNLLSIIRMIETIEETIVFPIHPRTAKALKERNLYNRLEACKNVRLISPVGYLDFIRLIRDAIKIITDSGGVQKEAYLLSVPCITIRNNTEWIEAVEEGWNVLAGTNTDKIIEYVREWMPTNPIKPIFGNGQTSQMIMSAIKSIVG